MYVCEDAYSRRRAQLNGPSGLGERLGTNVCSAASVYTESETYTHKGTVYRGCGARIVWGCGVWFDAGRVCLYGHKWMGGDFTVSTVLLGVNIGGGTSDLIRVPCTACVAAGRCRSLLNTYLQYAEKPGCGHLLWFVGAVAWVAAVGGFWSP